MKKTSGKKLSLGKIKIASLSKAKQEKVKGMGTTTCVISYEIACYSFAGGGGCSGDVC